MWKGRQDSRQARWHVGEQLIDEHGVAKIMAYDAAYSGAGILHPRRQSNFYVPLAFLLFNKSLLTVYMVLLAVINLRRIIIRKHEDVVSLHLLKCSASKICYRCQNPKSSFPPSTTPRTLPLDASCITIAVL